MLKVIANLVFDFAKLAFGGIIVGAIMRQDFAFDLLMRRGAAFILVAVSTGLILHYFDNRLKNK
jgi:hypothetical protein